MNPDTDAEQKSPLPSGEEMVSEQEISSSQHNLDVSEATSKSGLDVVVKNVDKAKKQEPGAPGSEKGIARLREEVRGKLAERLVWLVIGTAAGIFALAFADHVISLIKNKEPDTELSRYAISVLLTSNAALTGAALGFYFGDKSGGNS